MKLAITVKKAVILFMALALGVAMIACQGAAGVAGEPGQPGEPGKAAPQPPFIALEIPDIPELVQEKSKTVDLSGAFGDPEGKTLVFSAKSGDSTIATVAVSGSTLTVTGVKVGSTSVTATATDPDKLSRSQSFKVTVTAAPPKPVTIGDVEEKYPTLSISPTTAADVSKEIELPADHTLISENPAVVTVAAKKAAAAPAASIRWASATADTVAKNTWVVTAVAKGVTNVDVLDKSGTSVHTIRVTVTAAPPAKPMPVGTIAAISLKVDGTDTVDVSTYFSDPDKQALTYTVASDKATVATASVTGSTVTVTAVAAGTAMMTVTATDTDKLMATQTFKVTVTAPMAPTKVGTIAAISLKVDGTDTVDVSTYFSDPDKQALTYTVASDKATVATVSVKDSTVTVTAVAVGTAMITVTATDTDKLTATQTFTVTVTAKEPAKPVDMASCTSVVITGTKALDLDISTCLAAGSDTTKYDVDSLNEDVFTVAKKANTTSVWTFTAVSAGTAKAEIVLVADGSVSKSISVEVKNRAPHRVMPISEPEYEEGGAPSASAHDTLKTQNNDGTFLQLYQVSVPTRGFFEDPDAADDATLGYEIRSSRRDVVIQDGAKCSASPCQVWIDVTKNRPAVFDFELIVVAVDSAKNKSVAVKFPYGMQPPAAQSYIVEQNTIGNFRGIRVGYRLDTDHVLSFSGTDGFTFARKHWTKAGTSAVNVVTDPTNDTYPTIGTPIAFSPYVPGDTDTANVNNLVAEDVLKPVPPTDADKDTADVQAVPTDGKIKVHTIKASGSVASVDTLDMQGTTAGTTDTNDGKPTLNFQVSRLGSGKITIGYHIWGIKKGATKAAWYSDSKTLNVTVVDVK